MQVLQNKFAKNKSYFVRRSGKGKIKKGTVDEMIKEKNVNIE